MKTLLTTILAGCLILANAQAEKPNVLFIVSEDNSEQIGCYGESRVYTPHLDRLAETGVRYDRAYVPYSVCSPSRAAYLTGLYPRQTGHIGLATHRFAFYQPFKTIPAYLREAGYYTGFVGKTHVNPAGVVEDFVEFRGVKHANFNNTHSIVDYAEEARMIFENAEKAGKPFLAILNYSDAHRRFIETSKAGYPTTRVKGETAEPLPWIGVDTPRLRVEMRNYLSCMNRLDEGIGMVLAELEKRGLQENTLIIYLADHGADFPRGKTTCYEGGVKVPMIVSYPKSFSQSKAESALVSTLDILPTILREAGIEIPRELMGTPLQSLEEGDGPQREYLHTFNTGSFANALFLSFGICDDRYKLIYNPVRAKNLAGISRYENSEVPRELWDSDYINPPEFEVYDLENDPDEFINLASDPAYTEIQERLFSAMRDFQKTIGDPFLDEENIDFYVEEMQDRSRHPRKKSKETWEHLEKFWGNRSASAALSSGSRVEEKKVSPESSPGHSVGFKAGGNLTSFEEAAAGGFEELELEAMQLFAELGHAEIDATHAFRGKQCLRLLGGEDRSVVIHLQDTVAKNSVLGFQAERWTRRDPFRFEILAREREEDEWQPLYDGSKEVKVGRAFLSAVRVSAPFSIGQLKFISSTPEGSGVLIDDLQVLDPKPMRITGRTLLQRRHPVLIGKEENAVLGIRLEVEGTLGPAPVVSELILSSEGTDNLQNIDSAQVFYAGSELTVQGALSFGDRVAPQDQWKVKGEQALSPGENYFWISYRLKPSASLDDEVDAGCLSLTIDGVEHDFALVSPDGGKRIGYALRQLGQDGVHSTRIPGLVTTNSGTLLAVYDNRNRAGGDLPGDIDVGLSRSMDGGQTWSPMRVIMDMGDDPKWNYEGVGDPAILVDRVTGTIWVAAIWSHGNRGWHGSGPGMEPEETGQLMLARSDDDGSTWSDPINITKQVKDPKWRFVLQGPGNGITMSDGTLVFPAQFRGENREPVNGKPFSTLIYSKDRGKTWKIGTGVKIDTTEAQLVELGDGSIMINCRDNRGGSRSVHTTTDLGKTWKEHPTSRSALPEPVCMASLIRAETKAYGPLLFFSNPPQANGRRNMTIKVSDDEGLTWPEKWHTLVDERFTAYSCMTPVGENHIGLVYEAPGELYFVCYSIEELLRK
ncbi:MAG: sulfatase-like hydrolase/transferase [Verrucomicrobiales bacterium]|nr:sulfatase-like hydrolase/transferase [Verrucomicrobiales bacterium]